MLPLLDEICSSSILIHAKCSIFTGAINWPSQYFFEVIMFLAFFISFPICRYKKFYSTDSNAWGEFQHHRRVVGVICLARADQTTSTTSTGDATTAKTSDVSKLCRLHDDIRTQFDDSVFDSRLFLFRSPASGHVTTSKTTNARGSVDSVQSENTIKTSEKSSQDKNSVVAQANSIDQSGASTSSEDDVTSSQVDVGNSSNNNVQSKRSTSPMASSSRDSGFTEDSPGANTCSNSSRDDTVTSASDEVTSAGSGSQAEDILPPYVVYLDDVDQTGDFDGKFHCKLCFSPIYYNILWKCQYQANAALMDVGLLLSTRVIKTCFYWFFVNFDRKCQWVGVEFETLVTSFYPPSSMLGAMLYLVIALYFFAAKTP